MNVQPQPDLILNNNYLYLITKEDDELTQNSLTFDGLNYDWEKNGFEYLRLISINKDRSKSSGDFGGDGTREPIKNATFSKNIVRLSNCSDLSEFNSIYITAANDSDIVGNEIYADNSSMKYFRPIWIKEIDSYNPPKPNPNLPAVGSSHLTITGNKIATNGLSTTSGFVGINIAGASNSSVTGNEVSINGGTHKSITGISASSSFSDGGLYKIAENLMEVSGSSFNKLLFVSESVSEKLGTIDANALVLSGTNTVLNSSTTPEIGAVSSDSSNLRSELSVLGTVKIETKKNTTIYAGQSEQESVSNAQLTFDNGTIDNTTSKNIKIVAGIAEKESSNNTLIWKNASATIGFDGKSNSSNLIGGQSYTGNANNNAVEINASDWKVDRFTMAYASDYDTLNLSGGSLTTSAVVGAFGSTGAENNSVTVTDSNVKVKNIIGSYVDQGHASSTVIIDNSTIEGTVQLFYGKEGSSGSDSTLIIRGAGTDLSNARLVTTTSRDIEVTNNTLLIDGWKGDVLGLGTVLRDGQLRTFENIKFINTQWSDGEIIINSLAHFEQYDIDYFLGTYTVINPNAFSDDSLHFISAPDMQADESMTLVHAEEGIRYTEESVVNTQKTIKGNAGTATEFEGTLKYGENDITYSVEKVERAPQTTLLGDSRIAASAFVNQSSDLLTHVFDSFVHDQKYGLATFASAEGNKSQYDLDSSLKINGWNFMAGLRYKDRVSNADWVSALFFENGEGNYRTWNEHMGYRFKANGEVTYNGLGIASRVVMDSGLYVEGSLQAGQLKIDMGNALMDTAGNNWDFDSRSNYFGAHIGTGWLLPVTSKVTFDVFGKYLYTHVTSDTFRVNNEKYQFSDIDSQRLQLEGKVNYSEDNVTLYAGLGAEYEFDGKSSMKAASTPEFCSDLDGFTGIAEAGLRVMPSANSPWLFQANVKGWEGQRDGVAGTLTVEYQF